MNDGLAQHIIVSDTVHYDKRTNVGTVECILLLDVFGIKGFTWSSNCRDLLYMKDIKIFFTVILASLVEHEQVL